MEERETESLHMLQRSTRDGQKLDKQEGQKKLSLEENAI